MGVKMKNINFKTSLALAFLTFIGLAIFFHFPAWAQSGLEGKINETINDLIRIVNLIIVGFIVWSGFLIAKGEGSGLTRLIYGIVGLVVVNAAYLIINYFS
ncbi:MAG: hypothetical protein D6797_08865 [Bdellovibrio sp.]|nr:MAG: hypothetical protein D6797_08865 [Bdellovibrio sp.]